MKFLYVAGEASNWVVNLCNEFCKQGHEVTCVVQQADEYDSENMVEQHKNLTRVNVDHDTMFYPPSLIAELKKQKVYYDDYDFVFGSHAPLTPALEMIADELNVNWGVMLLDIPSDLILKDEYRSLQWKFWFKNMASASQIVFNTHVARDVYAHNTDIFFPDDNVITYATKIPEELSMSGSTIKGDYVLSICRLTQAKNVNAITKSLSIIDLPLKQVIIGRDQGDLSTIQNIANEHNIEVIYKDNVSEAEKFELIKNSLCLIYPQKSAYIGGLSPWESMALGKPTICSDYKVLRDLYKNHVEYFNVNSVYSLGTKIIEAYNNDYNINKLQFASDYAYEEASFSTMATKLLKIMSTLKGD